MKQVKVDRQKLLELKHSGIFLGALWFAAIVAFLDMVSSWHVLAEYRPFLYS